MNAYELADELTKMFQGEEYDRLIHEIPDVLRQKAANIKEAIKTLNYLLEVAKEPDYKTMNSRFVIEQVEQALKELQND
jgi:hypothetical protein